MKRHLPLLGALALALSLFASPARTGLPALAATAPPSPPPLNVGTPQPAATSLAPTPVPAGLPVPGNQGGSLGVTLGGAPAPKASGSPGPDDRKGIEGVWEVQIQSRDGDTVYDHFKLVQRGDVLTGTFMDNQHNDKKYPLAGSLDGKSVRLVVTKDDGTTMTFTATLDGTDDMVGMMQAAAASIAFTAAYRPKYKWIDSVSPGQGMLGGSGGVGP
ncbi:MAG: hypothetical protein JOZ38_04060 [Candidatus Eremiobacteraeota bacterium]|nr:hypothetical protein [Candidatus Eremiobacteraeota bacterium]